MANIVLGCDRNGMQDKDYQSTVAKILEKAGHTVKKLEIDPNAFASYSYSNNAKGKIGIYLIAAGTYSIADATYGNTHFKYNYFGIRPECSPNWTESDFDTKPIGADSDCPASLCAKIKGNSFKKINEIVKNRSMVVTGKDATEMGNNLVKAMGGETSSNSKSKSSASPIKTCIQELIYPWNGEVYCFLKDDTIHIGRISEPTETKLSLIEGKNIHFESINVTDIDPKSINKLIVNWNDKQFVLQDDARIKRFGEKKKKIKSSLKSENDVVAFAYREWNKLLKDSGRVLECKTDGSPKWRIGKWVRVYIPSFELNGYMYITKCSHDDTGKWITSLTLTDYPPDLGVETSKNSDDSSSGGDS